MNKGKWILVSAAFFMLVGLFLGTYIRSVNFLAKPDMVKINRIVQWAEEYFLHSYHIEEEPDAYPHAILDMEGRIRFASDGSTSANLREAIINQDIILDIMKGNELAGKILIRFDQNIYAKAQQNTLAYLITGSFLFGAFMLLIIYIFLNMRVFTPFKRLKQFANHIALGNLDYHLTMDRSNIFGAFTESFDIMREELLQAKQKAAEMEQSKKELTASLSHDIKTPVTSIKLISELGQVMTEEPDLSQKFHTIYSKAEQIDHLITNMFQASLEELGQLEVHLQEESSHILNEIIKNVDFYGRIHTEAAPACLLNTDRIRLTQVIDNIINNSYKYADTDIRIQMRIADEFLKMTVLDYGLGVEEEELPLLFQKFYRGKNALTIKKGGSGLGLHICKYLMEQMAGTIECANHTDGFTVTILIPLC